MRKNAGEDCSADGMVRATDGTRHNAKNCFWVECDILGIGEERCGEDCGHACVLHSDFNSYSALFCSVEFEKAAHAVTENIAESVMAEHYREYEGDKSHTVCEKLRANGDDNATYNQSKPNHAYGGHVRLKFFKTRTLAKEVVASKPDDNRENCDVKDVEEHTDGVHFDARVGEPKDQKRSHEWREECADHGHAYGISHVTFGQETHHVA